MSIQFPIPQFIGEAVRYQGGTWVWDGVAWHVDDTANRLDLAMIPAYLGQFVHEVTAAGVSFISLGVPDVYGATFVLSATAPLEGVKVYRNGELLILDDGTNALGDYTINRAGNRIEFLELLTIGDFITIGVLMPPDSLSPGRVDVREIKDLDTDWVTNPGAPTTGMVNGVRRTFDLLWDQPAVGQRFAVIGDDIELAVFVAGIRQRPGIDYTTLGAEVTMTIAPVAGVAFWALWYLPVGAGSGGGAIDPPQPPLDTRLAFYASLPGTGIVWQDVRGQARTVSNAAARTSLRADIDIIPGTLVLQADTQEFWRWTGTAWARYLDAGTFTARLGGVAQSLRSTTALQRPAAASLLPGQLWINLVDGVFGFGSAAGDPVVLLPRVVVSAGVADAGKIPALGAGGVLDQSVFTAGLQPYGTVNPGSLGLTDWDNAHLNGTTVVRGGISLPNRPPGPDLPYAGHYIAMGNANTGVLTAMSPEGNTVYVRPRNLGAWGAWIQVNSPGLDISSAMLRANNLNDVANKPASRTNLDLMFNPRTFFVGDLNTITETGLYPLGIGVSSGWLNEGTGSGGEATAGDAVLHVEATSGLGIQLGLNVMPASPARRPLRFRFEVSTGVWTPWVSLLTEAEIRTPSYATFATSGGTTILTAADADVQLLTGTLDHTVRLPAPGTLQLGRTFTFINAGTGQITIQASGGLPYPQTIAPGMQAAFTCITASGGGLNGWTVNFDGAAVRTGTGSLVFATSPIFAGLVEFAAAVAGNASLRVPPGVAPTTPVNGDIWTTAAGVFARVNGVTLSLSDAPPATVISDTAPVSPIVGQLWFKTVAPVGLFVWHNDGDSTQWVQVGGVSGSAPEDFATTAEARAGVVPDKLMSPALVQARQGVISLPATGNTLLFQPPEETTEVTLIFNGLTAPANGNPFIEFRGADALANSRAFSCRNRFSAAAFTSAGDDGVNRQFTLDVNAAVAALVGSVTLVRGGAQTLWSVQGGLRLSPTVRVAISGMIRIGTTSWPLALGIGTGVWSGPDAQMHWRI